MDSMNTLENEGVASLFNNHLLITIMKMIPIPRELFLTPSVGLWAQNIRISLQSPDRTKHHQSYSFPFSLLLPLFPFPCILPPRHQLTPRLPLDCLCTLLLLLYCRNQQQNPPTGYEKSAKKADCGWESLC